MTKIESVRHVINEMQDGESVRVNRIEYEFSDDATAEEKQAVRAYGCRSKDGFDDAIEWWDALQNASGFKDFMGRSDVPRARPGKRGP